MPARSRSLDANEALTYTMTEVAALLGVSIRTVRTYVADERLPVVRYTPTSPPRVLREDLDLFVRGAAA